MEATIITVPQAERLIFENSYEDYTFVTTSEYLYPVNLPSHSYPYVVKVMFTYVRNSNYDYFYFCGVYGYNHLMVINEHYPITNWYSGGNEPVELIPCSHEEVGSFAIQEDTSSDEKHIANFTSYFTDEVIDKFELPDEDKEELKKSLREKIKPGDLIYRR